MTGKILFAFALVLSLAGMPFTESSLSAQNSTSQQVEEISYATLVVISQKIEELKITSSSDFMNLFKAGRVLIEKVDSGSYRVTIMDGGGAGTIILINDL